MTILTKETDLLKFINEKKQKILSSSQKVVFNHYIKIIHSSIVNCFDKILDATYTINCVNIIYIIFWFLIEYSKNIKLSSFLCDRAILLYTEYILMLTTPIIINNNQNNDIDLNEVKIFVYKKTIGPLPISTFKKRIYSKEFYQLCQISKEIYSHLLIKISNKYTDTGNLDCIMKEYQSSQKIIQNIMLEYFFNKENFNNTNLNLLINFFENINYLKFDNETIYINNVILLIHFTKVFKNYKIKKIEDFYIDFNILVSKNFNKEIINLKLLVNKNVQKIFNELFNK